MLAGREQCFAEIHKHLHSVPYSPYRQLEISMAVHIVWYEDTKN